MLICEYVFCFAMELVKEWVVPAWLLDGFKVFISIRVKSEIICTVC
jgi:hypothetical protein